jgi:lipopolysaccharide transport system ATP-binding protein
LDPDVLLIDEVLGVGDESFREKSSNKMMEKIKSNKTVVIVSHSPSTIRDLCNRAVWIEKGISRAEGDPDQVLNAYIDFAKKQQSVASR